MSIPGTRTCAEAAKGGHLKILDRVEINDGMWDETVYIYTRRHIHSDILR